jgi:hypothetical protein
MVYHTFRFTNLEFDRPIVVLHALFDRMIVPAPLVSEILLCEVEWRATHDVGAVLNGNLGIVLKLDDDDIAHSRKNDAMILDIITSTRNSSIKTSGDTHLAAI